MRQAESLTYFWGLIMIPTLLSGVQRAIAGGDRPHLKTGDLHWCTDARQASKRATLRTMRHSFKGTSCG